MGRKVRNVKIEEVAVTASIETNFVVTFNQIL